MSKTVIDINDLEEIYFNKDGEVTGCGIKPGCYEAYYALIDKLSACDSSEVSAQEIRS